MKAVVLVSGGLDSCVALWECIDMHGRENTLALGVDYGQTHAVELDHAQRVCAAAGVDLFRASASMVASPLTGNGTIPKGRSLEEIGSGIAPTFVPARNLVFLSLGAAHARVQGAHEVWIGCNADDALGYPDCAAEFLKLAGQVLTVGMAWSVGVIAPHAMRSKRRVVAVGRELGAPLHLTRSCYLPTPEPCGACDACFLRALAMDP